MKNIKLDTYKKKFNTLENKYSDFKIIDKETYHQASVIIKEVRNAVREIETQRKKYTKPLDEAKRAIMADVKAIINPMNDKIKSIKKSMIAFHNSQQEERKRLRKKAMKGGEITRDDVENITKKTEKTEDATATIRERKVVEIIDMSKLPRKYLIPNIPEIEKNLKKGIKIKGAKLVTNKSVSIR